MEETQQEIDMVKLRKLIFQPKDELDELFVVRLNEIKEIFNIKEGDLLIG